MMMNSNNSTDTRLIGGFTPDVALEMWAESIIESHRYSSRQAAIAARYGEATDRQVRLPSAEQLKASGADIVAVARGLEAGLTVTALRAAIRKGLDLRVFSQALEAGLDVAAFSRAVANGLRVRDFADSFRSLDIDTLNWGLEAFSEAVTEAKSNPDPVSRVLARLGEPGYEVAVA